VVSQLYSKENRAEKESQASNSIEWCSLTDITERMTIIAKAVWRHRCHHITYLIFWT